MNRRSFLRGLGGVALGLPMLPSLFTRAQAAAAAPVKRFVVFWTGCGIDHTRFWPSSGFNQDLTEAGFAGRGIEPLAPWRDHLLVLRGLHTSPRGYNFDGAQPNSNDHELGTSGRLTAAALQAGSGDNHPALGISVDQELAKSMNPGGREALTLHVGGSSRYGADNAISYRGSANPVERQGNPASVYLDFAGLGSGEPQNAKLALRRQSVLDVVRADMDTLLRSPRLGQSDRTKLDLHFSSIRDIEVQLDDLATVACNLAPALVTDLNNLNPGTIANDSNFRKVGKLQMDVLALALACGYTRVATLMWGSGESGPVFSWLGHDIEHHAISHGTEGDYKTEIPADQKYDSLRQIDQWYAGQFAYLLEKLHAYKEDTGSVLENSAVMWTNELSQGAVHSFYDIPFIIAGGAAGFFKQNKYIKLSDGNPATSGDHAGLVQREDAPHNKLLTTIMHAMGRTDVTKFGAFGKDGIYSQLLL